MTKSRKYNWEVIEDIYVTGGDEITLQSLHDKFIEEAGLDIPSMGSLKRQSAGRKWWAKRKQYRDQTRTETAKKVMEKEVDIRAKGIRFGTMLQGLGARHLRKAIKSLEDSGGHLSPSMALQILKDGLELERKAMGMPDAKVETTGEGTDEREILGILAGIVGLPETEVAEILQDSSE